MKDTDLSFKAKRLLGSVFSYLYLLLICRWWTRLYRLIWEARYSTTVLTSYRSIHELVDIMRTCHWTADGWRQLWDAWSYPGRVQSIISTKPEAERLIGDCDEFAIYLAAVLEQSSSLGGFENGRFCLAPYLGGLMVDRARVLTLIWINKDGKYGGHNVCLIDWYDLNASRHNPRGADVYSYMDYDYPNLGVVDLRGIIEQVMEKYACGGRVLAWSIHDKDLKLEEAHRG